MMMSDGSVREPRMALDISRESVALAASLPLAPPPSPQTSLKTMESEGRKEKERAKVMSEAEVERLRAATRKYHALMELLATEAGYLMDLRALVTVYLEHVPGSSTSPTLSIPSLGLSRSIPSSRSSFLLPHPSPSTSASSHLSVTDDIGHGTAEKEKKRDKSRERLKDKERHKEKHKAKSSEKENTKGRDGGKHRHKGKEKQVHHSRKHAQAPARRPILADKDVSAICRNAQELLAFHDRFVCELRDAMVGFGLSRAFEMGERKEEVALKPDGSEAAALPTIDQAVAIVAEAFVTESPSFSVYEGFCPGHNEAVNLIRNVQENYPVEWDAYEQRCSLLVAHQFNLVNAPTDSHSDGHGVDGPLGMPTSATVSPLNPPVVEGTRTKRRHSTSSLTTPFSTSHADLPKVTANGPEPVGGEHSRSKSGQEYSNVFSRQQSQQATRLRLLDYLIKPVQRVCKYPLLIDQLRTKRARTQSAVDPSTRPSRAPSIRNFRALIQDGGDVVERAGEAMRLVVSLVNRASETQARLVRSSLITSRMVFTQPTVGSSKDGHASSPTVRTQDLSPELLASFGAVRLAGALDVVHHPSALHMVSTGSMRAKYFGAFLYAGGYLILVKIPRNGKVYEPRYWFSLVGFDLFDFEGDESSLPFSFHLCGHGHHLQLAAACQPEKAIWINAIQDALSHDAPWTGEPPSSLLLEDKVLSAPPIDDVPSEWSTAPLPTIQSDSELEGQARDQPPDQAAHGRGRPEVKSRSPARIDSLSFRYEQQAQMASFAALSRRSSTASVKAFFSPMTLDPSTRIPRPSAQVRQQVDHGLHDVYSEQCLAARSHATMKHEDLFKRPLATMSRSNSGLSISGAMGLAAKRRYDMVSGKRGSLDGGKEHDLDIGSKRLSTLPGGAKSPASPQKRLKKPLPSLVPTVPSTLAKVDSEAESEGQTTQSPVGLLDSPFPPSQCSSTTSSNLPSPVDVVGPILGDLAQDATLRPSDVLTASAEDWRPKRTRSMVDNVKYFFQSRPASPCSTSSHQSATPPPLPPKQLEVEPQTPPPPSSLTQWWRKGSLRRRVQSSPDVPGEESPGPPPLLSRASADGRGTFLMQTPEESMLQPSVSSPPSPAAGTPSSSRRVNLNDSAPTRRRSLFAPSSRQREYPLSQPPQPSPDGSSAIPRRSLRNVWFFQRSNSFTPMDGKEPDS
ncbi:uncharacterized protein B0H18DRAFT_1003792 [Fomitopsis serialis]|uniref:uncharacterized protein n=1 Tax=Fomitopsis serialis TaxID=139415 RepID=UPI0020080515|nr:uncharacterized protein B0H18DRAFT_1003792 [Neoantrodia serialis]KAH9927267.1 hypothetical protein B0H18DRAFT_1003792 [Neoantrodia serialis]